MTTKRAWWRSASVLAAMSAIVVSMLVDVVLGRAKGSPSDFALFIGRIHPLAVHLPIGIFILVAVGEAATFSPRLRPRVDPVLGLVLPLLLVSAVGSFVLGHLLAQSGDFPTKPLLWHRRLELMALMGASLSLIAFEYQASSSSSVGRGVYRGLLGLSLGLLSIGAHFGGTLTRGDTYLSKYAPGILKPLLGGAGQPEPSASAKPSASLAGAEPLVFADVVLPILRQRCVGCHGPEKVKARLRLDSFENIMRGGENGPVIVPGVSEKSAIIERALLPQSDDDHMPPGDRRPLTAEEIAAIEFWIDRGAIVELRVRDALLPSPARPVLERAIANQLAAPPSSSIANQTSAPSSTAPEAPSDVRPPATPRGAPASTMPSAVPAAPTSPSAQHSASEASTESASNPFSVLEDKCGKCHGPAKQKGKLRVDSMEALLRGGKDGPAIVPGDSRNSLLVQRIHLPVGDEEHMPPGKEPQLSAAEQALLVSWVQHTRSSRLASNTASIGASTGATTAVSTQPKHSETPAAPAAESPAPTAVAAPPSPSDSASASLAPPPPDPALLAELPETIELFASAAHPILLERCQKCHGAEHPKSGFEVTAHARLLAGGRSGAAVIAGDPDKSELFRRVTLPLASDEHMPPEGEPQLSSGDVELLKTWITLGAPRAVIVEPKALSAESVKALAARAHQSRQKQETEPMRVHRGCGACEVTGAISENSLSSSSTLVAIFLAALRRAKRG